VREAKEREEEREPSTEEKENPEVLKRTTHPTPKV